jgi:hypothetical protein
MVLVSEFGTVENIEEKLDPIYGISLYFIAVIIPAS